MLEDMPLLFDDGLTFATELQEGGKWDIAARLYRHLSTIFGNRCDMLNREANALYQFGDYRGAIHVLENQPRESVSSLLILARCWKELDFPEKSVILYRKAETIIERE